ncbi:gamma carbonic anhydrase family protein [Alteraurantiacibacter aquimixticola]|uniref:Gamma carbonic anhydrase family protein n=1 Tax=Alteraurantiacibacter aquimixticola TaxID=2489173 RepID=A0A4T3F2F8_9SPHN|nr:gamma carbonic anhydrase family protein [Alteraurantiacibacter aquimixticola]TIX51433.1 gamma carbonic anhydrase family protein [Alteraurantiacibacter aquimixticola]
MRDFPGSVMREHRGKAPNIHPTAFIAPGACLIGDVTIGAHASIWYNCVLRADLAPIVIGARSNIQDGTVIHVEGPREGQSGTRLPTIIGEDALVGHMALLHGCTVADRGFVGMGSIVMDGAQVGREAMLAAGALLPPHRTISEKELWTGRPAKLARMLRDGELAGMREQVAHYLELAESHS